MSIQMNVMTSKGNNLPENNLIGKCISHMSTSNQTRGLGNECREGGKPDVSIWFFLKS